MDMRWVRGSLVTSFVLWRTPCARQGVEAIIVRQPGDHSLQIRTQGVKPGDFPIQLVNPPSKQYARRFTRAGARIAYLQQVPDFTQP